jgi:hypothetical protein
MRMKWRNVLVALILFHLGAAPAVAQPEIAPDSVDVGGDAVRLTVEVSWSRPIKATESLKGAVGADIGLAALQPEVILEPTAGRVVEVIDWPRGGMRGNGGPSAARAAGALGRAGGRSWRLGKTAEGRVRARIEAPLDGGLIVRAGDQAVSMPLQAILERPQHTPPQSPLNVSIERPAWDSLAVDLGESARDGIVAPGVEVPVNVAYNILSPESGDVAVHVSAALRSIRGGEVLWRYEPLEVVPANRREPSPRVWSLTAPRAEGSYVLEIRASWEPAVNREGSRLGRLIRRRKPATATTSAVRRVTFAVVDSLARQAAPGHDGHGRQSEIDSIDLTRARSLRPLAAGRAQIAEPGGFAWAVPPEALIEPSRRDRLRGWIMRTGAEAAKLEPADASGLAWSAIGLKVTHPDRPHRLTLKIKGGEPAALGVALIESGGAGQGSPARLLLDACASGPPILENGPPVSFSWLVWPSGNEMALVLVNRSEEAQVRLGTVTLTELDDLPGLSNLAEPSAPAARTLGLYLTGPQALGRFGGGPGGRDALSTAQNLVRYLGYCGLRAVVLPEDLADRSARRALDGQADEDSIGPDRLETVRRVLARQGYSLWLELEFDRPDSLPGLPPPDSDEALRRGLVRIDRQGKADGPEFHPLNREVREAMKRRVTTAVIRQKSAADQAGGRTPSGLLIRLGPGPTLLGTPDTGLDDATFERFVHETFKPETARGIPGLGKTEADRFAVRSRYLAGVGRMPWLTWRASAIAALYGELAEAAEAAAPGAILAVVTPGVDDGPAGAEARRVDRAGLPPSQAWRSVGLDLQTWPAGPRSFPVLRGAALSIDALAHDLATTPDLDALVLGRPRRGLLLTSDEDRPASRPEVSASLNEDLAGAPGSIVPGATTIPDPDGSARATPESSSPAQVPRAAAPKILLRARPMGDGADAELPLGHAMAALDAEWLMLSANAVAGQEERIRRFAAVFRALPASPMAPADGRAGTNPSPFGIAVRSADDKTQTILAIANDSPYPIRLAGVIDAPAATVDDLGRGLRLVPAPAAEGRSLVLDLLPYGVSAIRIGAPRAHFSSVTPYPSEAVLASMQARFNELTAQLARLNRGFASIAGEPANPGFEPNPTPDQAHDTDPAARAQTIPSTRGEPALAGWYVIRSTSGGGTIAIDRNLPHTGQGSLKLDSRTAPVSVVSEAFAPNIPSSLTIQASFRASKPGTKIRVWVEGEAAGKSYIRRTELTVSTEWQEQAVRASDVPPGGLDSARLRFELLSGGSLWIDDLRIPSEPASKSGRLNAQRTLVAALQAYREARYADFARLAGSHWVRESTSAGAARLARNTDPPPGRGAQRSSDPAASALPPERKLR